MSTPTKEERQEWARLCEAATPGPWTAGRGWVNAPRELWITHDDGSVSNTLAWLGVLSGENREEATARLIAAARSALPRLLTALAAAEKRAERAEGERDDLKRALDDCCICDGCKAKYERVTGEAHNKAEIERVKEQIATLESLFRRATTAESALAALRVEVEGLRARLAKAQTFEWRGEDGTEWNIHSYDDPRGPNWNVCRGIKIHAHGVTLDAAWAAAEKAAAKKEGA